MASVTGGVYVPLDAGFCDTQAVRQVRRRFGAEGFEAYVRLLCMLLREPSGRISVQLEDDWADVADQLGMGEDEARELVAILTHYEALVVEDGSLWSPLVSKSIADRNELTERRKRAAQARWKKKQKEDE